MIKSIAFAFIIAFPSIFLAQQPKHKLWNSFLQTHVANNGNVAYADIKSKPQPLIDYLEELSANLPKSDWSKDEKLAYWINAYNAYTIKLIIDHYPTESIKSIKRPWDAKFIPFGNEMISLNHIEHDILRKMNEPRIHFAIVCASVSCPKLKNTAFLAKSLDDQLTRATQDFLNDESKNLISENSLELSKIFKWFAKDFKTNGSLIDFLSTYSDIKIAPKAKISYLDYNWDLNE